MKALPEVMQEYDYKYNIINRLITLEGGVKKLPEKKKELADYLIARGAKVATIRKWLVIERGVKHEIPASALFAIRDFFNQKYKQRHVPGSLNRSDRFEQIETQDLYCRGQRKIIPDQ